MKFIIDDERHAERQGEYQDFDQAFAELQRRAKIPWDQPPNVAPCAGWRGCGRVYEVVEYDDSETPWKELRRTLVLEVSRVRGQVGGRHHRYFKPTPLTDPETR